MEKHRKPSVFDAAFGWKSSWTFTLNGDGLQIINLQINILKQSNMTQKMFHNGKTAFAFFVSSFLKMNELNIPKKLICETSKCYMTFEDNA